MSFLLCLLSIVLSFLSACMMAYNAMAIQIAPWVAPVVAITIMIVLLQMVQRKWFKEHVVIAIAAGSLGGMVGMCVGLSWPTLYFLQPDVFATWMQSPLTFSGMIFALVFSAGSLAFVITHLLRYHLIIKQEMNFPMSLLVHNIIYAQQKTQSFTLMIHGLMLSSSWNVFTWVARMPLQAYLSQLHTIPVFLSIGFVAGQTIAIPLLVGMFSRIFMLSSVQQKFFYFEKESSFILTFATGMLFAIIATTLFDMIKDLYLSVQKKKKSYIAKFIQMFWQDTIYRGLFVGSLILSSAVLSWWNVSFAQQLYVLVGLFLLSHVIGCIVAEVGVLEVTSFVSFIILPLTYFFTISAVPSLILVVFCTVCIGVVVDLLFSYKISHLAQVAHERILKYQIIGFMVASCSIGFILWWYINKFHLGSNALLAQQALEQESFITFQQYNYQVLAAGFVYALFMRFLIEDMLVMIGGFMMPVSMSFWLILSGGLSYLVKDRKKVYPFWFGIYASHALWMFARAIFLQI